MTPGEAFLLGSLVWLPMGGFIGALCLAFLKASRDEPSTPIGLRIPASAESRGPWRSVRRSSRAEPPHAPATRSERAPRPAPLRVRADDATEVFSLHRRGEEPTEFDFSVEVVGDDDVTQRMVRR